VMGNPGIELQGLSDGHLEFYGKKAGRWLTGIELTSPVIMGEGPLLKGKGEKENAGGSMNSGGWSKQGYYGRRGGGEY